MSYETLFTTKVISTHCCACGRPLLDAQSVATGMGPLCRDKHLIGFEALTEEQRVTANTIIHVLGALRNTSAEPTEIKAAITALENIAPELQPAADMFRISMIAPRVYISRFNDSTYCITFGKVAKTATKAAQSVKWSFIARMKKYGFGYSKKVGESWELHFKAHRKAEVFELMKSSLSGAVCESHADGSVKRFVLP